MAFRVQYDDKELQAALDRIQRKAGTVEPWLKRVSEWQLKSVQMNWRQQGSRYMSGGWAPISEMTYSMRKWGNKKFNKPSSVTKKILEVTGQLRKTWEYAISGSGPSARSDVGSPISHAIRHHKGGTFPAPSFVKWKTKTSVFEPERTLIAIVADDMKWARKLSDDYMKEIHA